MPVNLSIKNVPNDLAEKLRRRAARAHRSLQGELVAILEAAVADDGPLTPAEVLARVRAMGLATPEEAVGMIREDRGSR
ncbi:MAG: FitA-like ribbon-helix-helix domain-containing protein [Planctomycetota bacterium]|jgi:plasmid stability protein